MRPSHLPDDLLAPADVPAADAPVEDVLAFAHRYHAYKIAGSLQRVGSIAVSLHDRWVAAGADPAAVLDEPVDRLRIALFHTARAYDHTRDADGSGVAQDARTWLRVLVGSIAAALQGTDGRPPDPERGADVGAAARRDPPGGVPDPFAYPR